MDSVVISLCVTTPLVKLMRGLYSSYRAHAAFLVCEKTRIVCLELLTPHPRPGLMIALWTSPVRIRQELIKTFPVYEEVEGLQVIPQNGIFSKKFPGKGRSLVAVAGKNGVARVFSLDEQVSQRSRWDCYSEARFHASYTAVLNRTSTFSSMYGSVIMSQVLVIWNGSIVFNRRV